MGYGSAWLVYYGCAGVFLALGFRVSRPWAPGVRSLVRCLAAATVLPVAPAGQAGDYWVPAFISALFEGLFQKSGDPAAALQILGMSWGLGLCLAALLAFLAERRSNGA
jgi:hypothetical protein